MPWYLWPCLEGPGVDLRVVLGLEILAFTASLVIISNDTKLTETNGF